MPKFVDHDKVVGITFGRLKVIEYLGGQYTTAKGHKKHYYNCECKCGNIITVEYDKLRSGWTSSCGCLQKEKITELGHRSATHGLSHKRLYQIYREMVARCYSPKNTSYSNYGGRGIYICNEWYSPGVPNNPGFIAFYNWSLQNGYVDPLPGTQKSTWLTIDRIDSDGPYAPWNCRWVTMKTQSNNKRNNIVISDLDGHTYSIMEFTEKYQLATHDIYNKLRSNWSIAAILYYVHFRRDITRRAGSKWYGWNYYDSDGFIILIPSIAKLKEMYTAGHK